MNKEFIPYEQALELKELGFDEQSVGVYIDNKLVIEDEWLFSTNQDTFIESNNYTAPLYQQAFRWFREEYNLYGFVCPDNYFNGNYYEYAYYYLIVNTESFENDIEGNIRQSPEESELACLKKLIEIVKNK